MTGFVKSFLVCLSLLILTNGSYGLALDISRSRVGQPAPELDVALWLTEKPATQANWVLVDFWATWCGPCRRSLPRIKNISEKFKNRLVVVGISEDDSVDKIVLLEGRKFSYAMALDSDVTRDSFGKSATGFGVNGIPSLILVGPDGIIRWVGHPAHLSDEMINNFLSQP